MDEVAWVLPFLVWNSKLVLAIKINDSTPRNKPALLAGHDDGFRGFVPVL